MIWNILIQFLNQEKQAVRKNPCEFKDKFSQASLPHGTAAQGPFPSRASNFI